MFANDDNEKIIKTYSSLLQDIREGNNDKRAAKWAKGQKDNEATRYEDDHMHVANGIVHSSSKWPEPKRLKATSSGHVTHVHHVDDRNVGTTKKPHYNRGSIKIHYKNGKIHLDHQHPHPSMAVKLMQLPLAKQKNHEFKVEKSSYDSVWHAIQDGKKMSSNIN
tara:strand:+ start:191 stop:682 length:492 start_codon:yes stop_codon:yes gene_type:complete